MLGLPEKNPTRQTPLGDPQRDSEEASWLYMHRFSWFLPVVICSNKWGWNPNFMGNQQWDFQTEQHKTK